MNRRQRIAFIALVITLPLAVVSDYLTNASTNAAIYVDDIERSLHEREQAALGYLDDRQFWVDVLEDDVDARTRIDIQKRLEQLGKEQFTILAHAEDALLMWSNNQITIGAPGVLPGDRQFDMLKLPKGYYERIVDSIHIGNQVIARQVLLPIKYTYGLPSDYLDTHFECDREVPRSVVISERETEVAIVNSTGSRLFYLDVVSPFPVGGLRLVPMFLYGIAFAFGLLLINDVALYFIEKYNPAVGVFFLAGSFAMLRYISLVTQFTDRFEEYGLWDSNLYTSPVHNSVGGFIVNILLVFWLTLFFLKHFRIAEKRERPPVRKVLYGTLAYSVTLAGVAGIALTLRNLILYSGFPFGFENVFSLSFNSYITLMGILVLMVAQFLFTYRVMLLIKDLDLTQVERLISFLASVAVLTPLVLQLPLGIGYIFLLCYSILYISLFDAFVDNDRFRAIYIVIWVMFFTGYTATLLFKYNVNRETLDRLEYARSLAEPRDTLAEIDMEGLAINLRKDTVLYRALGNWSPDNSLQVDDVIDQYLVDYRRLYNNFDYRVTVGAVLDSLPVPYVIYRPNLRSTKSPSVQFWEDQQGKHGYVMQLDISPDDSEARGRRRLFIDFHEKTATGSRVYNVLLSKRDASSSLYKKDDYDYAIYENNALLSSSGEFSVNLSVDKIPPTDGYHLERSLTDLSVLVYASPKDQIVIVRGNRLDLFNWLTLGSYLFALLVGVIVIIGAAHRIYPFLPNDPKLAILPNPSLRNRIQFSVVAVIFVTFLVIAFFTLYNFQSSNEEYHQGRQVRKTNAVLRQAQRELAFVSDSALWEMNTLHDIAEALSSIHKLDVNLYDLSGELLTSSESNVFDKKLIAPRMDGPAYYDLARRNQATYIQQEEIGDLTYSISYVPLTKNDQTVAYMGLPYYTQQTNLREDVAEFMGTLLNIYVLLLIMAGVVAIFVANTITKPLATINEKLKQFKLGSRNEPIEWHTKDELGELISEYNKMLEKLEHSATMLARSEREGAWREMAKQVAHEIKNPLTPMKLSIQYMLHAYRNNPENSEELLKRVSKTLVEQIDNLSYIATEFGNFAKMPKADNTKFVLNELVTSVFDLFKETKHVDITLSVPEEPYYVYADYNQMMRVLNNIIKNAIQAIPDDRAGEVHVGMYYINGHAVVRVTDNGTGIPEEMQARVFVPHFTTKQTGTGLGLAICKNIIESANGHIYFETVQDVGTQFCVELPVMEGEAVVA